MSLRRSPLPRIDKSIPQHQGKISRTSFRARPISTRPRFWTYVFVVITLLCFIFIATKVIGLSRAPDAIGNIHHHGVPLRELWGQYSPFFSVSSAISSEIPQGCDLSVVQLLARHGSRYPTAVRAASYNETIETIHQRAKAYSAEYSFLEHYSYALGIDDLTSYGENEMFVSGVEFFDRYRTVAEGSIPFIRASGVGRVLESARLFSQGYHSARRDNVSDQNPYDILVIGEYDGSNNTLNHGLCSKFENGPLRMAGREAQAHWVAEHLPPILQRVNSKLPGADLEGLDILNLMDLCPFETSAGGLMAESFCNLFTYEEWRKYDYFQAVGKFYGYGNGNILGPTQGVGFVNELIARLTNSSVRDVGSVNRTLDSSPETFPLGIPLYADFSHDNDMTSIFSAMGLYPSLPPFTGDWTRTSKDNSRLVYSASTTVPFGARCYVEKMTCEDEQDEMVRTIVNDRVVPLRGCDSDVLGRCTLSSFLESLRFARSGGEWKQCFVGQPDGRR